MKNKSLIKNAIFNVAYKILNIMFPLITSMYVARILLPEGIGKVSAAQNNSSYFLILASLGIPAYGIREISQSRGNQNTINTVFSELFTINFILTCLSVVLYLIYVSKFLNNNRSHFLYYIFGVSIFLNIINVDWLYQGLEEYVYIAIRSCIVKAVAFLMIIVFVKDCEDIYIYASISILSICGNYIFNIVHSRKYVKLLLNNLNLKRHLKYLLFLALCTISTELYARMDITMLDIMKNETEVGLYSYAHKIVNLVITFLVAITSVFLPRLSYYYQEDKKKFSALITIGLHLMIFISLPAFVGFLFLSEPIIYIAYGNDFIAASQILKIFAIMIPIKCIGDIICYQVMIASKRESTLMKSYFVVMIVNFGINILLIPCIGSKGAAIASIVSEVLAFICVLIPALRIVCVKINKRSVICDLISSIFLMFFLAYIRTSIQDNTVTVALGIICGFVIYIVTNLILKNPTLYYCYDILKKRGDKY